MALYKSGVLEKSNVQVLGTPVQAIIDPEDREIFAGKLAEINVKTPRSIAASNMEEAFAAVDKLGFPIIVRAAYTLGGLGSGFCSNKAVSYTHLIVFPLSINDSLVYGIFDTGAQSSLIERKEQNRIGLDTSAEKVYSFFPHTGKNPVLFQKSIKTSVSICHMQLKNPIEFSIVDGEHNRSVWGKDV